MWPWASHAETKTVGGMEREGHATLETKVKPNSAPTRRARYALLSRHRSISNFSRGQPVGGGSDVGSILHRLHPSSSEWVVVYLVPDVDFQVQ